MINRSTKSFTLIEPFDKLRASSRQSFTLIELLVVLALVAILSVVVVMTLNPAELLKQARDSNRLSDLATINTALNLFSTDVVGGLMGTSTVVYVSIPDTTSTCANLGLPDLASGWSYGCVTQQNLRNTDGTGWIPVNFQRISSNSPISQLPVDPTNSTSTGNYYLYITGGSWKLSAAVESNKFSSQAALDGGINSLSFEVGTNVSLGQGVGRGSNLIVNGTFDADLTSWTDASSPSGYYISWSSANGGRLNLVAPGGLGNSRARQVITVESGKTYIVTFDYPINSNIGWMNARVYDGATTLVGNATNSYGQFGQNITGTFSMTFVAISNSATVEFRRYNTGTDYLDNIRVNEKSNL